MAIKLSPAPKLPKPSGFSLPKLPQGKPLSSSGAFRASASGYGKIPKSPGGTVKVPSEIVSKLPSEPV